MIRLKFNIITLIFAFLLISCKSKKDGQQTAPVVAIDPGADAGSVTGLNLGNKAPEISLKNWNDSIIPLYSSIKGRIVLVDFWASWCGPCRYENPEVVAAYKKYKEKKFKNGNGFTVYSVSLDMDKEKWKQAVEKDKLEWPYHVSDLKMWGSEVVNKYDIKGIPTNVLINEKGIIVSKDLRGKALDEALSKLMISN